MTRTSVTAALTSRVWQKLQGGLVPVANSQDIAGVRDWVDTANSNIASYSYIPQTVFGYLGTEKKTGVTRFLPVISKEDLAIYYHLCGRVGSRVIIDRPNVFGGWRAIPNTLVRQMASPASQGDATGDDDFGYGGYFSNTFSRAAWFQEYRSFNDFLREIVRSDNTSGSVVTTDIANFYDSIDIGQLCRRLRRAAPDIEESIDLLEIFLGFWNRRTTGYQQSSKGIPQEMISDGSRNLSHFYLQKFDDIFGNFCSRNSLTYVRWADDIAVFGPSHRSLERAIYEASRLLLLDGLNLNAAKTKIYSRKDYERYRGLRLLSDIETRNIADFSTSFRQAMSGMRRGEVKFDTLYRAAISFIYRHGKAGSTLARERDFLLSYPRAKPGIIETLSSIQMLRLIEMSANRRNAFDELCRLGRRRDSTAGPAAILMLIREKTRELNALGISPSTCSTAINRISAEHAESEIVQNFCIPAAKAALYGEALGKV